jgi:hypothetical protein
VAISSTPLWFLTPKDSPVTMDRHPDLKLLVRLHLVEVDVEDSGR